jgi:hypothetical protein
MAKPMNMKSIDDPILIKSLETYGSSTYIREAIKNKTFDVNNAALNNYSELGAGFTPLLVAIYNGAFDVVDALLDHDASVRVLTSGRDGALQILFTGMKNRSEGRERTVTVNNNSTNTSKAPSPSTITTTSPFTTTSIAPAEPQWLSCMNRLIQLEHELVNVTNVKGMTPLALAMKFVQEGPALRLFNLLGISSMATIDTMGKNPMFHLLDGEGTSEEKCHLLSNLVNQIKNKREIEALVACRIQPVNNTNNSTTVAASLTSTIVLPEHPLSFLNQGNGNTLLHHAILMKIPDPHLISLILKLSGYGSSSLLHLVNHKNHTVMNTIRIRAAICSSHKDDNSTGTNDELVKTMVMASLMVIETHLEEQDAKSQILAKQLIIEEERTKKVNVKQENNKNKNIEEDSDSAGNHHRNNASLSKEVLMEEKKKQKRRKRRSKRARRRQRQKEEEKEEEEELFKEAAAGQNQLSQELLAEIAREEDEDDRTIATDEKTDPEKNAAELLDLMIAGNVAPSRLMFNGEDDGAWTSVGPRGSSSSSGRPFSSPPQQRRTSGRRRRNRGTTTGTTATSASNSTLRAVSPIFEYSGNNSGTHHSSLNGSLSSLDITMSPASSAASPPISPGFVLSGGNRTTAHSIHSNISNESSDSNDSTSIGANNWATVASIRATPKRTISRSLSRSSSSLSIDRSKETIKKNLNDQKVMDVTNNTKQMLDEEEINARQRLVELFPLASAVDVRPSHLVPVKNENMTKYAIECSAAQLDLMEQIHREALHQITLIRMERTRQSTMDEIAEMLQRGVPISGMSKSKLDSDTNEDQ